MVNDIQVAIIGGGFAGISTAYELSRKGIESLVIEAGKIAEGNDEFPSGTLSIPKPDFSKWITHAFDSNYETFAKIHNKEGAKTFLEMTSLGTELIRDTIKTKKPELIREQGSIVLAENTEQWNLLQNEHEKYLNLGFGMEYLRLNQDKLKEKLNLETSFSGGLFVPTGAMINQKEYIRMLQELSGKYLKKKEKTKIKEIKEIPDGVKIITDSKEELTADNLLIATNGFYEDKNLKGLLSPNFTFIQAYENEGKNTPGCWTFGEKYFYLARQDNLLMIGGADKKIEEERNFKIDETESMNQLKIWAQKNFKEIEKKPIAIHFGVYTRTKDELPIVGKFNPDSRITYIVGCNAIGHTTYNVAAKLIPSIMGYQEPTIEQKKFINFLSPERKTLR